MRQFEKLRILRAFRTQHANIFATQEDHHLLSEIGLHQARGQPLTLKQLFLLDIGSIATIQRRVRKLKELGIVKYRQAPRDRRSVELTLSPRCIRVFAQYDALMGSKRPAQDAAKRSGEPRHVCGLCDSDAGRKNLLTAFLARGLKRGDTCILVAPADVRNEIVAALPHRRRASEQILVSEGMESAEAQVAFLRAVAREAKQAGRALCLAADMSWTVLRKLEFEAVLSIERRLDSVAKRLPVTALCVYDARRFSSNEFLQTMKCHRDHERHPIVAG